MPQSQNLTADQLDALLADTPSDFGVVGPQRIDSFTTLFAEWELKQDDLLVHLFPRKGESDVWSDGQYLPKCRACGAERSLSLKERCPKCQKNGLWYVPGRVEVKAGIEFPPTFQSSIIQVVDHMWSGSVALEFVHELSAYVLQVQGGATGIQDHSAWMDRLCEALDKVLER